MAQVFTTIGISAEAGLLSARNIKGEDGKSLPIDFVTIESFEDLETVYHRLRNKLVVDGDDYGKYTACFTDSITEIQDKCKQSILARNKAEAMQIQDWGTLANKIERMVKAFRDLPMHYVCTALDEWETDKITGEVKVMPMLQGSAQGRLPAYFDEVFYHYGKEIEEEGKKKSVPCILTCNSGKFRGKDRSGRLAQTIVKPDFKTVFTAIFNDTKETT